MSSEPKGSPNYKRYWLLDDVAEMVRKAAILGVITAAAGMLLPNSSDLKWPAIFAIAGLGPLFALLPDMPEWSCLSFIDWVLILLFPLIYDIFFLSITYIMHYTVRFAAWLSGTHPLNSLLDAYEFQVVAFIPLFFAFIAIVLMLLLLLLRKALPPNPGPSPVTIPHRPRDWPIDRPDMLTPDNVDAFLRRFHFHDCEILSIHVDYAALSTAPPLRLVLLLSAREVAEYNEYWTYLQITCDEVEEYRLTHLPNAMNDIFTLEPHIAFFGGIVFINLEPDDFTWKGVEDFRRSPMMVAAAQCTWETMPEPE